MKLQASLRLPLVLVLAAPLVAAGQPARSTGLDPFFRSHDGSRAGSQIDHDPGWPAPAGFGASRKSAPTSASNVILEGHLGGATSAVDVTGTQAYIGVGDDLVVLDVSNPAQPAQLGRVTLAGIVSNLQIAGHYAYVAVGVDLYVVDISTPAALRVASQLTPGGTITGLTVAGSTAYLVGYSLWTVDVSTSTAPRQLGVLHLPSLVQGVAVAGAYVYVADWYSGVRVIQVSDPTDPYEVGSFDTGENEFPWSVTIAGQYAYASGSRLNIFDVSNPASAQQVGSYETEGFAYDTAVAGNIAYVVDWDYSDGTARLTTVNVTDPTHPLELGHVAIPGFPTAVRVGSGYAHGRL